MGRPKLPVGYKVAHQPVPFTGVARSMICVDNHGFKNFKIMTLTIQDGVVIRQDLSDPFASFEAIQKLELANDLSQIRLNSSWLEDRAWYLRKDKDGNPLQDGLSS